MKLFTSNNIILLFLCIIVMYAVVDIGYRFKSEHFGIENIPVKASNDRKFHPSDDVFNTENKKILYDVRQHVLSNDFKKYFYFSEIDIPNRIMSDALKRIVERYGSRKDRFINYKWKDIPKREINKEKISNMVKIVLKYINRELPGKDLDEYYKPKAEVPREGGEEFSGKNVVEHYYNYDENKKEAQYYDLHHFKIVSVQKYNNMYRRIVNMYIHRKDKSTLFVIQLGSIAIDNMFKIVSLNLISRESADVNYLDRGYDEEEGSYKYLYEDPNLDCEMPSIFNERMDKKLKPNCRKVAYDNVSRNRIPDYVTSDEKEIREILDARYSSYKGFFRPVRFSFGEVALTNRKKEDDLVPKTNQRFLDRL